MNLEQLTRLYDFTGRTVAITGGTGVLGGEMACALAGCGANVAMLDRNLIRRAACSSGWARTRAGRWSSPPTCSIPPASAHALEVIVERFGAVDAPHQRRRRQPPEGDRRRSDVRSSTCRRTRCAGCST